MGGLLYTFLVYTLVTSILLNLLVVPTGHPMYHSKLIFAMVLKVFIYLQLRMTNLVGGILPVWCHPPNIS